jgi:hypothetical protein
MLYLICVVGGMTITPFLCVIFDGYWDFLSIILGGLLGLVLSLVLLVGFTVALGDMPTTVYKYSTTELVALNDGISGTVHGTFFLGAGYASSSNDLEYRFIYRTEKGMTVGERRATNVYLEYIEDGSSPRLVKYKERYDNKFFDWLIGAVTSWEIFYIPEGSITSDIVVDLQ